MSGTETRCVCGKLRSEHVLDLYCFPEGAGGVAHYVAKFRPAPPAPVVPTPSGEYPTAARVIHLHLAEFCDESLSYPYMIADASRRAAEEVAHLRALASSSAAIREAATRVLDVLDAWAWTNHSIAGVSPEGRSSATVALDDFNAARGRLRAALSSSGASPTDTNPTTDE